MPEPLSKDDQSLLDFVADRDVPCPRCGYNLRALRSCACPECGETLELKVGATQPYLIAWIVTTVAMLLPSGVGLLLTVVFIRRGSRMFFRVDGYELFSYGMFAFAIVLSMLLLRSRKTFLRRSVVTQKILAGVSIIYCGIAFILFFSQM